jgi:hypothetical protein
MYETKIGCISRTGENVRDWPCIWIVEDEQNDETGKCISELNLNCSEFISDFQCLYLKNEMVEGENLKCFWDITDSDGKCKTYSSESVCSNDDHYEIKESKCSLRECGDRKVNDNTEGEKYPCGFECLKDINTDIDVEDQCVSFCSNNAHYTNSDGICTNDLIATCSQRTVNDSARTPCGENCVKETTNLCADNCSNPDHYTNSTNEEDGTIGTCILIPDCTSRKVIEVDNYPCGTGCFKDIVEDKCVSICSNSAHYTSSDGTCTNNLIYPCSDRKVNTSTPTRCGDGCVENEYHVCADNCSNTEHYYNSSTGTCFLVENCSLRSVNNNTEYPCGSGCFKDVNSVVGSRCVSSCSNNAHYTNNSGVCSNDLIVSCSDRRINGSANTPCGEKCVKEETNGLCASSCSNTDNYEIVNGICKIVECSSRKINSSAAFPCGDDCFKGVWSSVGDLCILVCEDNSKEMVGICRSCEDISGWDGDSCRGGSLSNCYYKEGRDFCVSDCGSGYEVKKDKNICEESKTSESESEPKSKSRNFPWWIIVIVIVILVVVVAVIIIIIWRKKKKKEKNSILNN